MPHVYVGETQGERITPESGLEFRLKYPSFGRRDVGLLGESK